MKGFILSVLMIFPFSVQADDLRCLALNIFHEARGESEEAQMAVAHVTLNRVNSSRFPDNICDVVKQARRDEQGQLIRHKCQFSWYCDGKSDRIPNHTVEQRAWKRAKRIAETAIEWHKAGEDFSQGALFYHADYVSPYWADTFEQTVTIDQHIFYK